MIFGTRSWAKKPAISRAHMEMENDSDDLLLIARSLETKDMIAQRVPDAGNTSLVRGYPA